MTIGRGLGEEKYFSMCRLFQVSVTHRKTMNTIIGTVYKHLPSSCIY